MENKGNNKQSRVYQIANTENRCYGIVSAYLSECSKEINIERHSRLRNEIRNKGYSFVELTYGYTYYRPRKYAVEDCFFIPDVSIEDIAYFASGTFFSQEQKQAQIGYLYKDDEGLRFIDAATGRVDVDFSKGMNGNVLSSGTLLFALSTLRWPYKMDKGIRVFDIEETVLVDWIDEYSGPAAGESQSFRIAEGKCHFP